MAILNYTFQNFRFSFRRGIWVLLFWLILMPPLSGSKAWPADFNQDQIRATFIYNLANFVEWPAEDRSKKGHSFVITVIGNDEIYRNLQILTKNEQVKGEAIVVKHYNSIADITNCRILFAGSSTTTNMAPIINEAAEHNVLTVGTSDRSVSLGGMVNLRYRDRRIHIEINLETARKAGFKFNAKLLKVATITSSKH